MAEGKIDKETKDKLWRELKLKWSALKRASNSSDEQKVAAKKRINEIQDELGLDKTDFTIPYEASNKRAEKNGEEHPNYKAGADENTRKILGALMDSKRHLEDKLDAILNILEKQKQSVFETNDIQK